MLRQFTKEKDLVRTAMTHFATSYLALGCLNNKNGPLMRMFVFPKWRATQIAKTVEMKSIKNVIMDKEFRKSSVIMDKEF